MKIHRSLAILIGDQRKFNLLDLWVKTQHQNQVSH